MPAKSPEEVDTLFEQGMNAGDAKAVAALYEQDAVLVAQPGMVVKGRAAILQALEAIVAGGTSFKLNVIRTLTAGDTAVVYNEWTGTTRSPAGDSTELAGKAIEIVRRQPDGTWLFAIDDPFARG
jgi:uncharacterized protein (TIGR02246 family)